MIINHLDSRKVSQSLKKFSETYSSNTFIAYEIYQRLEEHLPAGFIASDALNLLQEYRWLTTNEKMLGYQEETFDLIVANLIPLWVRDLNVLFAEVLRLLKPGGIFLFSTLGVDTLQELRSSFYGVDADKHVHQFYDMHDLGDRLLQANFSEPVMDMERLTLYYDTVESLVADLTASSLRNFLKDGKKGCMTPRQWQKMCQNYQENFSTNGELLATFEVVYGCAKKSKSARQRSNDSGVVEIFLEDIKGFG